MKKKRITDFFLTALLVAMASLAACSAPVSSAEPQTQPPAASDDTETVLSPQNNSSASGSGSVHLAGNRPLEKTSYTDADYALALSFQTDGYQTENAALFDKQVMDWENEEKYHKTEDALLRLFESLPDSDPHADFIFGTLSNVWESSQMKHYKSCDRESALQHRGFAWQETFGDIYGDQVLLTGAYAEFDFNYLIADEASLTVGERDSLLGSIEEDMKVCLSQRTKEELSDSRKMEKVLNAELEKLLAQWNGKIRWGGKSSLSYRWNAPYEWEAAVYNQDGTKEQTATPNFQKCYDLVLEKLHFDTCQDMSVAEFARLVNAAFSEGGGDTDSFSYAWEYVMISLPYDDINYSFFQNTVSAALKEYQARAQSVYTQSQVDPSCSGSLQAEKKEDVFGDTLAVAGLSAYYTLSYRILDADRLTVKERDQFLAEINSGAKSLLETAMANGSTVGKEEVKNALKTAAENADVEYISLTDCDITFFEPYSYN